MERLERRARKDIAAWSVFRVFPALLVLLETKVHPAATVRRASLEKPAREAIPEWTGPRVLLVLWDP